MNSRLASDLCDVVRKDTSALGFRVLKPDDDAFALCKWTAHLFGFDPTTPLSNDMATMNKECITLELTFSEAYPFEPPFVRIVEPRFVFHTGHVTIGGSLCMELLTKSGWSPVNDIESVLVQVRSAIGHGNGRLDFANRKPYSDDEARQAFTRVAKEHRWQ